MEDIIQIAVMLLFMYLLYRGGLFIWAGVLWVWTRIGWTYGARFQRIVRRADKEQEAVSQLYITEMQHISDTASHDILRRK